MTITNKVSNKSVMPGITPIPDVVDAPTIGTATDAGDGTTASVSFTAAATGGAATSFFATSTPGSISVSSATSPISVTGLTAGVAYTFKVYGSNSSGSWSNVQSAASNSLTLAVPTSFQQIATANPGGSKTLTFSSIPQTYTHLQIRGIYQYAAADNMEMTINGGTNATASHWLRADGSGVYVAYVTSNTIVPQAGASTTDMYGIILDFVDYTNTNKNKVVRNLGGVDRNGTGTVWYNSILYGTTSAITSITLSNPTHNFVSNTTFALYGIKGS